MPRLKGYRERVEHDFGWVVELGADAVSLFSCPTTFPPGTEDRADRISGYWSPNEQTMVIIAVAIDRTDVELEIQIGGKPYFFTGPWLSRVSDSVVHTMSVFTDAILEGKHPKDVVELVKEILKESTPGSMRPLIVPVRQALRLRLRLLPGGSPGPVHVHMRTLLSRDVC